MVRNWLRRALFENFTLKAVSLGLALALFVLVRGDKDTERMVRVGLAYTKPTDRDLITDVPDGVDVRVRGPWTRIKRLDPSEVDPIVIDLTKANDGDIPITEDMIRLPAGLRVASVRPSRIGVAFADLKKVAVIPEPVGTVADGFLVAGIEPEPMIITIRGPKNLLESVGDVRTLPIPIAGKRTSFQQSVPLAPLPKGITSDADNVDVKVTIEEEMGAETVAGIPVVAMLPPANTQPPGFDLVPAKIDVTVRGSRNALKRLDRSGISAIVELRLDDFTPGVTRKAAVQVQGIPAGLAIDVDPREVTLTMKGPVVPAPK